MEIGREQSDENLLSTLKTIGVNECCMLVYTVSLMRTHTVRLSFRNPPHSSLNLQLSLQSGTVGNPKAVMLNHNNILSNIKILCQTVEVVDKEEILVSYLPLSHIAAQVS